MKAISLILVLFLINSICKAQGTVTGNIVYANSALTSIHDSTLVRLYQGTTLLLEIPVASDGSFTFDTVPNGTYIVKAFVTKKPGGFTAKDSYLVSRHFVGLNPQLTGIYLVAADVNNSGGIPAATDEIAILRRYTHRQTTFYYPQYPHPMFDWVSQNMSVTVIGSSAQTITVQVLCTGDVDGSFIPE